MTNQPDRPQPSQVHLEEAILGAMMLDSGCVDVVRERLPQEAFYHQANRDIYRAVCALSERGDPTHQTAVMEELAAQGNLERAGGPGHIIELFKDTATSGQVEYHARLVYQAYVRRTVISRAQGLLTRAYEPTDGLDDLLGDLERLGDGLHNGRPGGISGMSELVHDAVRRVEEAQKDPGSKFGVPTGLPDLDKPLNGLQRGDLIVVAGRPSAGKTALLLFIARAACAKVPVLIISREMLAEALVDRLLSLEARVNSELIRSGTLEQHQLERVLKVAPDLARCPLYITDRVQDMTQFVIECRRAVKEYKVGLIVSDYLQKFDPPRGSRDASRVQQVGAIARAMKDIATELRVPHLAAVQLSRAVEARESKRPALSDLRDSGEIEQEADEALLLYRPEYYGISLLKRDGKEARPTENYAEINIAKQRNGPTRAVHALFDRTCGFWACESNRHPSEPEDVPRWVTE